MKWKSYYRHEFDLPGTKEYLDMMFSRAEEDTSLDSSIDTGSILSFPHTALHYAAMHQARVIISLYRAGVEQVIALGVLHLWGHAVSSLLYRQAMASEEESSVRQAAFSTLVGAFTPIDSLMHTPFGKVSFDPASLSESPVIRPDAKGLLVEEFSLDTFFSLLHYYYLLHDHPLPRIVPLYIGMTRNPLTGSFAIAGEIAAAVRNMITPETAVVATGDVVHYGTGYSTQEVINGMPKDADKLKKALRDELEKVLTQVINRREYEHAFSRLDEFLNNDQRYLLPVVAETSGNRAEHSIISFELSDYSSINDVAAPCVVASSLVAYRPSLSSRERKAYED